MLQYAVKLHANPMCLNTNTLPPCKIFTSEICEYFLGFETDLY